MLITHFLLKIAKKNFSDRLTVHYISIYIWVVDGVKVGVGGGPASFYYVCACVASPLSVCDACVSRDSAPIRGHGQEGQGHGKPWYHWV
jgi:hypothetical protein